MPAPLGGGGARRLCVAWPSLDEAGVGGSGVADSVRCRRARSLHDGEGCARYGLDGESETIDKLIHSRHRQGLFAVRVDPNIVPKILSARVAYMDDQHFCICSTHMNEGILWRRGALRQADINGMALGHIFHLGHDFLWAS